MLSVLLNPTVFSTQGFLLNTMRPRFCYSEIYTYEILSFGKVNFQPYLKKHGKCESFAIAIKRKNG